MKKSMVFLFVTVAISIVSSNAYAQRKKTAMPDDGFWVIKSNVKTPTQNTIYFYTNNRQCVGEVEINGKKLNVSRRKVVKELNSLLAQSLTAFHKKQSDKNDAMLANKWD